MRYLFSHREKVFLRIRDSRGAFLFLDYDGTLTPIVQRPEGAKMPTAVRKLIRRLNSHSWLKVAIISGRSLKDVKKMVGIDGLIYAGNHGLEIQKGNEKISKTPGRSSMLLLELVKLYLKASLKGIRGVLVEDKGSTLSVHFRMAGPGKRKEVKEIFAKILRPYKKNLRLTSGKMVLEIRPAIEWDKGRAVLALLGKSKALPIYIGDDITDNDAFRALKGKGVSIFVGRPRRAIEADYYLKDTKEVEKFLRILLRRIPDVGQV